MSVDLRWCLAVVLGAGGGLGRDVALGLGRAGAGVLAVDADAAAAAATARDVEACRVRAWAFQADVHDELDRRLLEARCRDLGGADLLVNPVGAWDEVAEGFLAGLAERRGRRDVTGLAVNVGVSTGHEGDVRVRRLAEASAVEVLRLLREG